VSVARYSREIVLDDLNNVHTFAVLSVPPGGRVLDMGAADGSVARALGARGCAVTAVERDAEAVATLRTCCAHVVPADIETLEPASLPPGFDDVLLLDVLEHLVDPLRALRLAAGWLAPHGRLHLSVPNVAHGAVRLALLQGRWQLQDTGLLDRTHLRHFDHAGIRALVHEAGLEILEEIPVLRAIEEADIPVDLPSLPADVVRSVRADPSAEVYQFFIIARHPRGATLPDDPPRGMLADALAVRLRAVEATYRTLEAHATSLDGIDEAYRALERHARHLQADAEASRQALAQHRTSLLVTAELRQDLEDAHAARDVLEQHLVERMRELQEAAETLAVLKRDAEVYRAYASELARQVPRIAALGGEDRVLAELDAYRGVAPDPETAWRQAVEAAEFARLRSTAAFRLLGRLDGGLRRVPRLRQAARAIVRRIT
jgi:2-polyprenyl-3-methyl-5-hydroxy-6-metoxy-1,4-benzoquinol methylase